MDVPEAFRSEIFFSDPLLTYRPVCSNSLLGIPFGAPRGGKDHDDDCEFMKGKMPSVNTIET